MTQDTLVLIKPDGVQRRMVGQIVSAIESLGFLIKHLEQRKLSQNEACNLYKEHEGKWHFPRNIKHIISNPVVILHVHGEEAVAKCRGMVENFRSANRDVIKLPQNLAHATDNVSKAMIELQAVGCIKSDD